MHSPRSLASALVRVGVTIAAAIGLVAFLSSPVMAAGPSVRLQAVQGDDGAWTLTAQVDDARGNPASNANVEFDVRATFLGAERVVTIGTAVTDTSGAATVNYVPTWNGQQVLTAAVAGSGAVSAPASIDVAGAARVLPPDPPTLGLLRSIAPPVGILAAFGVWALLGGTFLYALFGIAGKSRRSTQRSRPATAVAIVADAAGER